MASIVLKRTGHKMPLVGFGLWKVTKDSTATTVYNAIKEGYRLFDGASDYGNEKQAGEGVARALKDGIVKRDELFITSKLWNSNHAKEHVREAAEYSLKLWGLDYFDLYLIHFPISIKYIPPATKFPQEWEGLSGKPEPVNVPYSETWAEMEKLADAGLAKNIGVSNVSGALLYDVTRYARIQPDVLQVELHPYLTQEALVAFAQHRGIVVTAYSSFGPQGYKELSMDKGAVSLFEQDPVVKTASKLNKTPAQVLLRWATQRGIAVIPKSNDHSRLVQNLASTDFNLSEEDIKAISALNINLRLNDPVEIHPDFAIFA